MAKPHPDQSPLAGYLNNFSASIESHSAYRHGFRIITVSGLLLCIGEAVWIAQHQPTPEEKAWTAEETGGPWIRNIETWPNFTVVPVNATKHFGSIWALEEGWNQFRSGYSPALLSIMDQETNVFIFMDVNEKPSLPTISANAESLVKLMPEARLSADPDFCVLPIWVPEFPRNFASLPESQQSAMIEDAQSVASAQIMEHYESRAANPDMNCRDLPSNQTNYELLLAELRARARFPLVIFSRQGY